MENPIESIDYKGHTINIYQDTDPSSPREWDNLGVIVAAHKRYDLGEVDANKEYPECDSWKEVEEAIIAMESPAVILPLYLYDHSGITIRTVPFSDSFDSGQVGFIYMTKKTFNENNYTDQTAIIQLCAEIKTYDQYLTGEVYGFDITGDCDDSCWGFFGDDGMKEAISNAKESIDYHEKTKHLAHIKKTKTMILNHVPLLNR